MLTGTNIEGALLINLPQQKVRSDKKTKEERAAEGAAKMKALIDRAEVGEYLFTWCSSEPVIKGYNNLRFEGVRYKGNLPRSEIIPSWLVYKV